MTVNQTLYIFQNAGKFFLLFWLKNPSFILQNFFFKVSPDLFPYFTSSWNPKVPEVMS